MAGAALPEQQNGAGHCHVQPRHELKVRANGMTFGDMTFGGTTRAVVVLSLCVLGAHLAADAAQARQFSATIVTVGISRPPSKIFVADEKVRIETPELPDSFFLIDGAVPGAYLVRPKSRVFMDAKQSSRLTRLFVPLASDDPCVQWQTMAEVAGMSDQIGQWHCEAAGNETVAGRDTVRFTATSPRGRSAGWIDRQLEFPVKIETEDGAVLVLQDIKEEPQSADLFIIPAGYKKFDPRALLEWLKHSDVWVEPAH